MEIKTLSEQIPEAVTIPTPGIPLPNLNKKSFFNSKKRINRSAIFLIVAGAGALWLTYWWNEEGSTDAFGMFPVLDYYIFNSVLLILLGVILYAKSFRLYSILAIVLGISVTTSMFVFEAGDYGIGSNLFLNTTLLGMSIGTMYGGIILVPMFLWGVYRSLFRGIKHLRGKAVYNPM